MPRNTNRIVATVAVAALAGGGAGAGALRSRRGLDPHDDHRRRGRAQQLEHRRLGAHASGRSPRRRPPASSRSTSLSTGSGSTFPRRPGLAQSAEGTGFVYDTKGDIVTNDHVVAGASSVTVKFPTGRPTKATVVGKDPDTDLAVIQVNAPASKLVPLALGDSSKVAVGDGVVAIGNPFGLDDTVTSGIVSAINREITSPDNAPIDGAIQTDAAINHGNSGGPLLNLKAQVIGVTSQIQSDSGGNDGVGFAVPSNTVRTIATS